MEPVLFERKRWTFVFFANNDRKWRVTCEVARTLDSETGTLKEWPELPVSVVEVGSEDDVTYIATYDDNEQKTFDTILGLIAAHNSIYLPDEIEQLEYVGAN